MIPVIRVLRDPVTIRIAIEENRSRILSLLNAQEMTVSELAETLRKDVSTVYRHVNKLLEVDLIEVSGEKKVHHIPEKVYRRTARIFLISPEATDRIDPFFINAHLESISGVVLDQLERMGFSIREGQEFRENFIAMIRRVNHLNIANINSVSPETGEGTSIPVFMNVMMVLAMIHKDSDPELRMLFERFVEGLGLPDRSGQE